MIIYPCAKFHCDTSTNNRDTLGRGAASIAPPLKKQQQQNKNKQTYSSQKSPIRLGLKLEVTPISFHEKCEISPIDMTFPDD